MNTFGKGIVRRVRIKQSPVSRWLFRHAGKECDAIFYPDSGFKPQIYASQLDASIPDMQTVSENDIEIL